MEKINFQDIINKNIKAGITDLEVNIVNDKKIEIGYWSFDPVDVITIENNVIVSYRFSRPKGNDEYCAPKEKWEAIEELHNFIYKLLDEKTYIDTSNVEKTTGVFKIFHNFYNVNVEL